MEQERSKWEQTLRTVNENDTLKEVLKILSYATLFVVAYAFFYGASILLLREVVVGLCYVASILLPYLLVWILSRMIKAPRPVDLFDFYEKKGKKTYSFPDRLVFLSFAVGTLTLAVHFILGLITLALSLVFCVCRVLLGNAFPRDVITGGISGVLCAVIGYFLLVL